jgi:hypothetical protein
MKNAHVSIVLLVLSLAVPACSAPKQLASESSAETSAPTVVPTTTPASSTTVTVEPSTTPTPTVLDLEIVEWNEYPYTDLADPQNTDTRVEILVRNPNEFPVKVNRDAEELRFLNAAGEVVYTNPNPTFYFYEGSWILGGETSAMSACVCFMTSGLEKQEWESLELVTPLEPATEFAYTTDVDVTIGEWFNLSEAHLGGDQLATEITMVNASTQVLKSFAVRVIARDASGKYVGVAIYGSFDADSANPGADIEPGASGGGLIVTLINYFEGPLNYEVMAIGIPAEN